MTLTELTALTRELTGIYSTDVVSDALIQRWINESYNEIARARDWDWLEANQSAALPAAAGGVHTIALVNGTRRVLEFFLVRPDGSVVTPLQVANLSPVEPDDKPRYDVNFAGQVTLAPVQDEPFTYKIRYLTQNVNLTTGSSVPVFAEQFHASLAYRAAVKVLAFVSDNTNRSDYYMTEYGVFLDGMVTLYELSHDNTGFQMGQDGVLTRKYFPWFKPA
jgi:hypothetical protein